MTEQTPAQKRAIQTYRDNNREKINAQQRCFNKVYYETHKTEILEAKRARYKQKKIDLLL